MLSGILMALLLVGAPATLPTNNVPALPPGAPPELLWPGGAPGAVGKEDADKPAFTVHLPAKDRAVGAAVVVLPGGGYTTQAMGHEGADIAAWLNQRGVAAFVLRYRVGHRYRHPAPLLDAQHLIRLVRNRAKQYAIAPDKIGVWGFSAGGHLASLTATLVDEGNPKAKVPLDRISARPDFAILAYPVIFMEGPATHDGSRRRLLGDAPAAGLAASLSTNTRVSVRTPPTFLFHTAADTGVPPENSVAFFLAMQKVGVPCEMHIFEKGSHGVGLAPKDPILSQWAARLEDWLKLRGVLAAPPATP